MMKGVVVVLQCIVMTILLLYSAKHALLCWFATKESFVHGRIHQDNTCVNVHVLKIKINLRRAMHEIEPLSKCTQIT